MSLYLWVKLKGLSLLVAVVLTAHAIVGAATTPARNVGKIKGLACSRPFKSKTEIQVKEL